MSSLDKNMPSAYAQKQRSIKASTPSAARQQQQQQQASLATSAGGETATFLQFVRLYAARAQRRELEKIPSRRLPPLSQPQPTPAFLPAAKTL